jgi:predicted amidohydrolase
MSLLLLRKPILLCIIVLAIPLVIAGAGKKARTSQADPTVRVAGILLKWTAGDREVNYRRAERLIREASENGARVVCTAESFLDGYAIRDSGLSPEQWRALAEPVPSGPYCRRMCDLADTLDIYLVAAITELDGDKVYNSAILIGPDGRVIGTYRKRFLWIDEKGKYTARHSFPTFPTEFGRIGMMICSDRRQQAAIEELVENGAQLVFCPAGGGYGPENDRVVRQRSREGKVPIVFVHPIEFLVTGPDGSVIANHLHGTSLDAGDSESGVVRYCELPIGYSH